MTPLIQKLKAAEEENGWGVLEPELLKQVIQLAEDAKAMAEFYDLRMRQGLWIQRRLWFN